MKQEKFSKQDLPQALRKIREERGLSVMALSEISGVAFRTIYNVENGESVRLETVEKMAAALGLRLHSEINYKLHKLSNTNK